MFLQTLFPPLYLHLNFRLCLNILQESRRKPHNSHHSHPTRLPHDTIHIRDFAYPTPDPRHNVRPRHVKTNPQDPQKNTAPPPLRPRATERASRRSSGFGMEWSVGSESGSFGTAGDGRTAEGGTFGAGGSGAYPRRDDFERNFDLSDAEPSNDDGGAYLLDEYENADDNLDYAADQGEDDGEEGEEGPLPPGIYLALFDFEPEGQAVGRGGGVRWAVVIREEFKASTVGEKGGEKSGEGAEEYALVPKSYLKFVREDEEDGDDEEGDE
ncbi:hypothetical protein M422DRAFT_778060 [Sphaerobolus stellatus SS14]|nr:hypothetical protein M422DRAFT_778060 [Sphaerobolus stellatus SS14]